MKRSPQYPVLLAAILLVSLGMGSVGTSAEPGAASGSQDIRGVWHMVSAEGAGVTTSKRLLVEITDTTLVIRQDKRSRPDE